MSNAFQKLHHIYILKVKGSKKWDLFVLSLHKINGMPTFVRVIITNLLYGITDNSLVVNYSFRCDFTTNKNHACLGNGFYYKRNVVKLVYEIISDLNG